MKCICKNEIGDVVGTLGIFILGEIYDVNILSNGEYRVSGNTRHGKIKFYTSVALPHYLYKYYMDDIAEHREKQLENLFILN